MGSSLRRNCRWKLKTYGEILDVGLHLEIWLTSASESTETAQHILMFEEALSIGEGIGDKRSQQLRVRYVQYDQFRITFIVSTRHKLEAGGPAILDELAELEGNMADIKRVADVVCKGMILGAVVWGCGGTLGLMGTMARSRPIISCYITQCSR